MRKSIPLGRGSPQVFAFEQFSAFFHEGSHVEIPKKTVREDGEKSAFPSFSSTSIVSLLFFFFYFFLLERLYSFILFSLDFSSFPRSFSLLLLFLSIASPSRSSAPLRGFLLFSSIRRPASLAQEASGKEGDKILRHPSVLSSSVFPSTCQVFESLPCLSLPPPLVFFSRKERTLHRVLLDFKV